MSMVFRGVFAVATAAVASSAMAATIDVTASLDKASIDVGETALLTVTAQVRDAQAGQGIFFWDVDLVLEDLVGSGVLDILEGTLTPGPWEGNASTSSKGTVSATGLDAIYDNAASDDTLGVGSAVTLFTVQVEGLAQGEAKLSVAADDTVGGDFATWLSTGPGEDAGDYTNASANLTVVPEPATAGLVLAGVAMLARRRR